MAERTEQFCPFINDRCRKDCKFRLENEVAGYAGMVDCAFAAKPDTSQMEALGNKIEAISYALSHGK
jgi:hypothetical protein